MAKWILVKCHWIRCCSSLPTQEKLQIVVSKKTNLCTKLARFETIKNIFSHLINRFKMKPLEQNTLPSIFKSLKLSWEGDDFFSGDPDVDKSRNFLDRLQNYLDTSKHWAIKR